jgi:hypothetical protein
LIEFRPVAQSEFRLEVAKMRVGGLRPRPIGCRVVDLEDDRLDIETETGAVDPVVKEVAEQMVVAIENAGERPRTRSGQRRLRPGRTSRRRSGCSRRRTRRG